MLLFVFVVWVSLCFLVSWFSVSVRCCLFRLVVLRPTCVLVVGAGGRPVFPLRLLVGVVGGCRSPFLQSLLSVWAAGGVVALVVVVGVTE